MENRGKASEKVPTAYRFCTISTYSARIWFIFAIRQIQRNERMQYKSRESRRSRESKESVTGSPKLKEHFEPDKAIKPHSMDPFCTIPFFAESGISLPPLLTTTRNCGIGPPTASAPMSMQFKCNWSWIVDQMMLNKDPSFDRDRLVH